MNITKYQKQLNETLDFLKNIKEEDKSKISYILNKYHITMDCDEF